MVFHNDIYMWQARDDARESKNIENPMSLARKTGRDREVAEPEECSSACTCKTGGALASWGGVRQPP
jgi:hypothetical protein